MRKNKIVAYWMDKMREPAVALSSLKYLKTGYLGLYKCHPIYSSCGSSPWEIQKACIQARLFSGRYRLERLTSRFTKDSSRCCALKFCQDPNTAHEGNLENFFLSCTSLAPARREFNLFLQNYH